MTYSYFFIQVDPVTTIILKYNSQKTTPWCQHPVVNFDISVLQCRYCIVGTGVLGSKPGWTRSITVFIAHRLG